MTAKNNSHNFIALITGPAGAGKSTVAQALAEQIDQCVNLPIDDVKEMIINGFLFDRSPKGQQQWRLTGKNIGQLARNFHEAGYNIIINGYINDIVWSEVCAQVDITHRILLRPDMAVAKERNQDPARHNILSDEEIERHYHYFATAAFCRDFMIIDSTSDTTSHTIAKIDRLLRSS